MSFLAHDGRPVLLLEDFDHLLDGIHCANSSASSKSAIDLVFGNEEAFSVALQTWSEVETFVLVTSHATCNSDDDRGAYM